MPWPVGLIGVLLTLAGCVDLSQPMKPADDGDDRRDGGVDALQMTDADDRPVVQPDAAVPPTVALAARIAAIGLGNGSDGDYESKGADSINDYARVTIDAPAGGLRIAAFPSTAFREGDVVIVWQDVGLPTPELNAAGKLKVQESGTGQWEINRVKAVGNEELTLEYPMLYAYPKGFSQVVRVPQYRSVTIREFNRVEAKEWSESQGGGLLALLATGIVTLDGDLRGGGRGLIEGQPSLDSPECDSGGSDEPAPSGASKGGSFIGGGAPSGTGWGHRANGGGGGTCAYSGGGGGGGISWGGRGAAKRGNAANPLGGRGGAGNPADPWRLYMGGGGGGASGPLASRGGRGGGVAWLRARELQGRGSVNADGHGSTVEKSARAAAGGGGGGGTVWVQIDTTATCGELNASGGLGEDRADGFGHAGGGGGGQIILRLPSASALKCTTRVEGGWAQTKDTMVAAGPSKGRDGTVLMEIVAP